MSNKKHSTKRPSGGHTSLIVSLRNNRQSKQQDAPKATSHSSILYEHFVLQTNDRDTILLKKI